MSADSTGGVGMSSSASGRFPVQETSPIAAITRVQHSDERPGVSGSTTNSLEKASEATLEQVQRAIDDLNQATQVARKHLSFQFVTDADRLVVRVMDLRTQEVIKEIPPEKVVDAAVQVRKLIGLLLDERV